MSYGSSYGMTYGGYDGYSVYGSAVSYASCGSEYASSYYGTGLTCGSGRRGCSMGMACRSRGTVCGAGWGNGCQVASYCSVASSGDSCGVSSSCGSSLCGYSSEDFSSCTSDSCMSQGCSTGSCGGYYSSGVYASSYDGGGMAYDSGSVVYGGSTIADGSVGCSGGDCGVSVMGVESGVVTGVPMEGSVINDGTVIEGGMPMEGSVMDGTVIEGSTISPAPSASNTTPPSTQPKTAPSPQKAPESAVPATDPPAPAAALEGAADPSTGLEDSEDMFGTGGVPELPGANDPASDLAPPQDAQGTPPADDGAETDDLFNESTKREGVSVESLTLGSRKWSDNTGRYATVGKLVRIGESFVRIEKSTGRLCTVPFSRLCDADYAYVQTLAVEVGLRLPIRLASAN